MSYFKNDDALSKIIKKIYDAYVAAKSSNDIHSNVIDPFSALLESSFNKITYDQWIEAEKSRQIQKTLQNAIGNFHENIIGEIKGFKNLKVGEIIDIISEDKKIIAEIKNKWNTTKGNHKVAIYDDIASVLTTIGDGFTGYYVEIVPKTSTTYNKEFTPSDNKTHSQRTANSKIRVIDGKSFYAMITGDENAIFRIYNEIVEELKKLKLNPDSKFKQLLTKAYGESAQN
jgi:type-2 restriction enzyme eco47II